MTRSPGAGRNLEEGLGEHGQVLRNTKIRAPTMSTGISALQVDAVAVAVAVQDSAGQCSAAQQGRRRSAQMCFQEFQKLPISTCNVARAERNPGLPPETRPRRPFRRFARLCHRTLPRASPHHRITIRLASTFHCPCPAHGMPLYWAPVTAACRRVSSSIGTKPPGGQVRARRAARLG